MGWHVNTDKIVEICVRQGLAFEGSVELSVDASATNQTLFVTGDSPVILYQRNIGFNSVGVNAFVYRDPTVTDLGTLSTGIRNSNDINPKVSQVKIYGGPTVTDKGEQTRATKYLFASESNQSGGQLITTIGTPQFLLPNMTLLLEIENRDTNGSQAVVSELLWCEPDRIPGVVIKNGVFTDYTGEDLLS